MDILESYAFHYYSKDEGPLASLSSLARTQAIEKIKGNLLWDRGNPELYMDSRITVEEIMFKLFTRKGGRPKLKYPYYFTLGERCKLLDGYKDGQYIKIPIKEFDLQTISFTYGDSFEVFFRMDAKHATRRKVYTIYEINDVINQYGIEFFNEKYMNGVSKYIEMQVWDDNPLIIK